MLSTGWQKDFLGIRARGPQYSGFAQMPEFGRQFDGLVCKSRERNRRFPASSRPEHDRNCALAPTSTFDLDRQGDIRQIEIRRNRLHQG